MANCTCNDFPIACAPHAPGGDCCHHPHGCPPHPCPPPAFKGGTSMYIGARYVPIFADPVEWDDKREYEPLTIVTYNGDCYTSKCYVPKGAQLPPYPDGQTKYWVKTSDYNYQFADLKQTVADLSRLVEQFQKDNEKFTELINGWNETVKEWTAKMEEWQGQMDDFESRLTDLNTALNEEIARAKAAESANKAAIDAEVSRATKAEKALDTAYKAADAAIREDFTAEDTALGARIDTEKARAEDEETKIRQEFAAADTELSNRITINKTDIDAIKAEQAIQNTNISNNAKNIADNSAEIAKHAARLTSLESNASDWDTIFPDTTIAQEVQKEELARANADTALNGRCDAIAANVEEVRDIANHKVDTTTYTAGQAAQDAKITAAQNAANKANTTIGDWKTDHPGQTISECATSVENEIAAVDAKADANAANIGDWNTEHPGKTISQAVTDCLSYDKSGVVLFVSSIPSIVAEPKVLLWLDRPLRLSPADEAKQLSFELGIYNPATKEFTTVGTAGLTLYEYAATTNTPVTTPFASTSSAQLASKYCVKLNPNVSSDVVGVRLTSARKTPNDTGFNAVKITW